MPSNSNGAAFNVPLHLNGLTLRAFGHQRVVRDQESDARFSGPWVGALLNNGGVPVQCILPLSFSRASRKQKNGLREEEREPDPCDVDYCILQWRNYAQDVP